MDDSSPRPASSGAGRRRRLAKKTTSPRSRSLPLTSESSEASHPGPIAGPSSTESAKGVLERRCKSLSPRKNSRMTGGSRERSKERGRSGTRRRSVTAEDDEAVRQRRSRSQVAHELKMLTEGLPKQLKDSYHQLSVSESKGSSRLEHQQSATSHGSSTMGCEDTLEKGLAAQLRFFSPPRIRHPVYDECREGHGRLYLQVPKEEETQHASGQPSEDDEEQQCSSEQHPGPIFGQIFMVERSLQGYEEEMQPTELEAEMRLSFEQHTSSFYGNIYVGESWAAQLYTLSPRRISRDFGRSEEVSPTGEWLHS